MPNNFMGTVTIYLHDSTGRKWELKEVSAIIRKLKLPGVIVEEKERFFVVRFTLPVSSTYKKLCSAIESYGLHVVKERP